MGPADRSFTSKFTNDMKYLPYAVITAICGIILAAPALAADPYLGMEYARGMGLPSTDIRTMVANVIRAFMGLLGLILVMQIMWGGFLMMTHGGNEDRKTKAVGTLKGAVIGMILIMMSASIADFVVDAVMNATGSYL